MHGVLPVGVKDLSNVDRRHQAAGTLAAAKGRADLGQSEAGVRVRLADVGEQRVLKRDQRNEKDKAPNPQLVGCGLLRDPL